MAFSSRAILIAVLALYLVTDAHALVCKNYTAKQAGSRCGGYVGGNPEKVCCVGPDLWCDMGRCSLRKVSDAEKVKQANHFESKVGGRCDINNGISCCCSMTCVGGRCQAASGKRLF